MKLLLILAILFTALVLMTVVVERFAKPVSEQNLGRMSRLLPILVAISLLLGMARLQGWI